MIVEGELSLVDAVHDRNCVVPNAEESRSGDEAGEKSLPHDDVEKANSDRIGRNQAQEDECGGV